MIRLVYQLEGDERRHTFFGNMIGEELLSGTSRIIRLSIVNGQGKIEKDIYKNRDYDPHIDNLENNLR